MTRCQGLNINGKRCKNEAWFKFDLTAGKKMFGYNVIPAINCCFFCKKHAVLYAGYNAQKIGMILSTRHMDNDEYVGTVDSEFDVNLIKTLSK